MWRWRQLGFALVLLASFGCEVATPPSAELPTRLVGEDWSLRFEAAGGSGYLKIRHRLGTTLAELHHVRLVLGRDRQTTLLGLQSAERHGDTMVLTCASHPDHDVEVHVRLGDGGRVEVEVIDVVGLRSEVREITLDYLLPDLGEPDETWLPHQHAGPDEVAGDGSFHAPVAFVRRGDRAVALLPDREGLARQRRIPQALELDLGDLPRLRHGLIAHAPSPRPGGGFHRSAPVPVQGETLRFGHTLRMFHQADADTSYRVFRELWDDARIPSKTNSIAFDSASDEFFTRAVRDQWQDLSRGKVKSGFFRADLAEQTDGVTGSDAWYSMRQQSLRTAYGALLFGNRTGRPSFVDKARQSLEHILTAPSRVLLPSLFVTDPTTGRRQWILDSTAAGDPNHYHTLDVATTCSWMLRLAEHFPEHRAAVHALCRRTARFFRQNQLPSGAFPSFFEKVYLHPRLDRLYDGSAETGSVAQFLIEFGTLTGDDESIGAARRALDHIDELLLKGEWLDVESIAVRSPIRDPRSGVRRQGTLGLIHCALAAARFGTIRPAPKWRRLTARLLGQLSRYQQVWSPPWVPGARIGGFGAGNFDHRWNDARQGLAALAFFAGYRLTDDSHWLDRGIAALDAAMLTADRDHQPARDGRGPKSSLHWGPGTSCTAAEIARADLGAAVIDMQRGTGRGIDALWIEGYELTESRLELQVLTRAFDLSTAKLCFRNIPKGIQRLTVIVNLTEVGTFTPAQLQSGIAVRPAWMPTYTFAPPKELSRDAPWHPRALATRLPEGSHGARIEVRFGTESAETFPLTADGAGMLNSPAPYIEHRTLPIGAEVRSRLLFEVAGETYSEPREGFRVSIVSNHRSIDPGEGDDVELVAGHDSRIRRFVDGMEFGRYARGTGSFTYRAWIKSQTNKIEFVVRTAGRLRVRVGDIVLHEDKADQASGQARDLTLELSDHRMWAAGEIALTFEPITPNDEVDVASIRYSATGHIANLDGLGPTRNNRAPARELHVVVQPLSLIDRALDVDREALQMSFFGGADYEVTPLPVSRRTVGSVARFIDALSGGRTVFKGAVLPAREWKVVTADCDRSDVDVPADLLQNVRTTHETADVVVAILSSSQDLPLPRARQIRIGNRRVPLIFLPVRNADGSFLSCGTATAAILHACYGAQPLRTAKWGNFGDLALSGTDSHVPPGPPGINLARTGWSDHLLLKRRNQDGLVISPLGTGRVGFVLDCNALPGRGQLFLECRTTAENQSGVLMYWVFDRERPVLRNLEGAHCAPSILRMSATHGRPDTPFLPGSTSDLFRVASRRLPTRTPTGEELWRIHDFRMLAKGHATFDVRYLATDLVRAPGSKWLIGDALEPMAKARRVVKDTIRRRDGETWLSLPARSAARIRLQTASVRGLFRVFSRVRGIHGSATVTLGAAHEAGGEPLVTTTLNGVTERRWLQADLPRNAAAWLDVRNAGDTPARIVLSDWIRVPRVRPIHQIRPSQLAELRNSRLMDGVVYGRALRLPASGKKIARTKTPVVIPAGPVAIRIRAGLPHDAPTGAEARLTVTLIDAAGTTRAEILDDQPIRRFEKAALFLTIAKLPAASDDRVEFLRFEWTGAADIRIVDLAIIRP